MKRSEAMAALEEGKKITQVSWRPECYLVLDVHGAIVDECGFSRGDRFVNCKSWELHEELGHGWVWAKEQLRAGKDVKRKEWFKCFKLFAYRKADGEIIAQFRVGSQTYATSLTDQDAEDWIIC